MESDEFPQADAFHIHKRGLSGCGNLQQDLCLTATSSITASFGETPMQKLKETSTKPTSQKVKEASMVDTHGDNTSNILEVDRLKHVNLKGDRRETDHIHQPRWFVHANAPTHPSHALDQSKKASVMHQTKT